MDLRTGRPLWPAISSPPSFAPLAQNERCDVAIVGAGITGALLVWELNRRGISTVVVDKRDACMGSTVACTALVQYEIDRRLVELGCPAGQAGRKLHELADHHEDLKLDALEEGLSEADAEAARKAVSEFLAALFKLG